MQSPKSIPFSISPERSNVWGVAALCAAAAASVLLYAHGLPGPFLFDDHIHISQNRWVQIDDLAWSSLAQAWHSSFSSFPSDRPLAQLTFGVNHALAGPEPFSYKATNLALHLLTGLAVFFLVRRLMQVVSKDETDTRRATWVALLATTFWLLHPIHVSTVLYAVQRMTQLSTLGLVVALYAYVAARQRLARGESALGWFAAVPLAGAFAFLGKENAVLLPGLLLAMELTILRGVSAPERRRQLTVARIVFIAAPILLGLAYLVTHPGLLGYSGRPFSLEERGLTQTRVLWHYLYWLAVPDIRSFGLFHDDIVLSTSLTAPLTTSLAIAGHAVLLTTALWMSRRWPVFAFAVLFFYAAHALESTILPLEMVFEHRNYLASIGPLLFLAYAIIVIAERHAVARMARVLGVALLAAYALVTFVRVDNWSSFEKFVFSGVENHPASPRYNFLAAKTLISTVHPADPDSPERATLARHYLDQGLAIDPDCINCLFGHLVLSLHEERAPSPERLQRLANALRDGYVDATSVSVSQFSYLVKWQQSGNRLLSDDQLTGLFDAALANRRWNGTGRAGIHSAYREYYETVAGDLETALHHADQAIRAWPDQWAYYLHKARILRKLERYDAALTTLDAAANVAANSSQEAKTRDARRLVEQERNDD
jgi:hypothetical protein